jgi:hypothetical protein
MSCVAQRNEGLLGSSNARTAGGRKASGYHAAVTSPPMKLALIATFWPRLPHGRDAANSRIARAGSCFGRLQQLLAIRLTTVAITRFSLGLSVVQDRGSAVFLFVHGRACRGHEHFSAVTKAWMPGTSPGPERELGLDLSSSVGRLRNYPHVSGCGRVRPAD